MPQVNMPDESLAVLRHITREYSPTATLIERIDYVMTENVIAASIYRAALSGASAAIIEQAVFEALLSIARLHAFSKR